MSVEIRKLLPEELPLANDFFNRIYGSARSFDDFKWEFMDGPAGPAVYVGAIDTSVKDTVKVVGIQCAIPIWMRTPEGEQILTAKSEDTLVDPDYRGQAIFDRMYALLFEECRTIGIRYVWGFTPAYKPFVKVGFQLNFKSSQLLFVQRPVSAFSYLASLNPKNTALDRFKIFGLCLLSKALTLKAALHGRSTLSVEIEKDDGVACEHVMAHGSSHSRLLHLVENTAFLHWRMVQNPLTDYRRLIFRNAAAEIVADVIISHRKHVGYIERMIFDSGLSAAEKKEVVIYSLKALEELKLPLVRFLGFAGNEVNRSELQLLSDVGFFKVNRGNWFVWKCLDDNFKHQPEDVFLNRLFSQGVV